MEHYRTVNIEQGSIANLIWRLEKNIKERQLIRLSYERLDGTQVERVLQPISVIFSDYYFYLLARRADVENSAVIYYRLDRIKNVKLEGKEFYIDFKDRKNYTEINLYTQKMFMGERTRLT